MQNKISLQSLLDLASRNRGDGAGSSLSDHLLQEPLHLVITWSTRDSNWFFLVKVTLLSNSLANRSSSLTWRHKPSKRSRWVDLIHDLSCSSHVLSPQANILIFFYLAFKFGIFSKFRNLRVPPHSWYYCSFSVLCFQEPIRTLCCQNDSYNYYNVYRSDLAVEPDLTGSNNP